MAKILVLPKCPYCKKKISYIGAMFMKTKGEHNCPYCKCISNVVISRAAYALASLVCISSLLIVVLYSIAGDHSSFLGLSCVLAPFLIFYIVTPLLVRLVPCKDKSAVKKILDKAPQRPAYEKPAPQPVQKPVTLDVDENFSAKFMRAKSNVQKNAEGSEITDGEAENAVPEVMEDIRNNAVDFEINGTSGLESFPEDENIRRMEYPEDGSDIEAFDGEYAYPETPAEDVPYEGDGSY